MSGVVLSPPAINQHQLPFAHSPVYSSPHAFISPNMSTRKRKADDDPDDTQMDRPSASPSPGPPTPLRIPSARPKLAKRPRTNLVGRQLSLPRLLETLSPDQLRAVLRNICDQHPDISSNITATAPRPSVDSALSVLASYEASLREAFPYGGNSSSEYAYNRVRQSLISLLDALKDYTPNFLPPSEQQPTVALHFLDGATDVIHRLPEWDSYMHNRHKQEAYEEIAQAWALVVREAAKRGGGIQLHSSGWDQKLAKHHELSGGKLQDAISELRSSLGWIEGTSTGAQPGQVSDEIMSIRQQLMSNTFGSANPIQVGPW